MGLVVPEIESGGQNKKKWAPFFFLSEVFYFTSADPPCPESTECRLIIIKTYHFIGLQMWIVLCLLPLAVIAAPLETGRKCFLY